MYMKVIIKVELYDLEQTKSWSLGTLQFFVLRLSIKNYEQNSRVLFFFVCTLELREVSLFFLAFE